MKRDKRNIVGIAGTTLVHLFVILFLLMIYIQRPKQEGESGVPIMLGNVDISQGMFDPATMTEVDILPREVAPSEEIIPQPTEQDMITQTEEESITIQPKNQEKPKVDNPKQPAEQPREKTEAEKRAEAEKAAAEAAAQRIAGAFGKGLQMENKGSGNTASGNEGSLEGNTTVGQSTGTGGYGTFDLGGRSLGKGEKLPVPVYNVPEEGRVVVTITVNPAGEVIRTDINKRTTTISLALRKAAEDAAKKARFEPVPGVNNQTGTITYYFKLK